MFAWSGDDIDMRQRRARLMVRSGGQVMRPRSGLLPLGDRSSDEPAFWTVSCGDGYVYASSLMLSSQAPWLVE